MPARRIPLWLKIGVTLWVLAWIPAYWWYYGPANFLWFCDIANLLLPLALWIESPLLLSWQAVSVLFVQVLWCVGFFGHLLFGAPHLGTGYMFQSTIPLWIRGLSLFHVVHVPIFLWGIRRLGYDRRAIWAQTATAQVILPISYWVSSRLEGPDWKDLNWVWGPFDERQTILPPLAFLGVVMAAYPILLYLPTHLFLRWWAKRGPDPAEPAQVAGVSTRRIL